MNVKGAEDTDVGTLAQQAKEMRQKANKTLTDKAEYDEIITFGKNDMQSNSKEEK